MVIMSATKPDGASAPDVFTVIRSTGAAVKWKWALSLRYLVLGTEAAKVEFLL